MEKVRMRLESYNGNALNLLGAFASNARHQGWSESAIEVVRGEAMAGDYHHLLRTLSAYTERPEAADGA